MQAGDDIVALPVNETWASWLWAGLFGAPTVESSTPTATAAVEEAPAVPAKDAAAPVALTA